MQFGFETEPTWATIRRDVFGEIRLQSLIGSTVTSISEKKAAAIERTAEAGMSIFQALASVRGAAKR